MTDPHEIPGPPSNPNQKTKIKITVPKESWEGLHGYIDAFAWKFKYVEGGMSKEDFTLAQLLAYMDEVWSDYNSQLTAQDSIVDTNEQLAVTREAIKDASELGTE